MSRSAVEVGVCLLDGELRILDADTGFVTLTGVAPIPGRELPRQLPWCPEPQSSTVTVSQQSDVGELVLELRRAARGLGPVTYVATVRRLRTAAEAELARELRSARQTLDSLVTACPVAILTLDLDKRVTMWNPAGEEMFGWSAGEILGQPYPLVPRQDWGNFEALFERVISGSGFTAVESTRRRKDGSPIDLRMHTAPMRNADGEVIGAMALLEDLSERRQLEERVRHAQKMEAVGRLAGGVAHDFNNLLAVIVGMCDLLELEGELSERGLERVEEILRVASSARELIAQLMTFSRRQVMRTEIVDVNERVRGAARMIRRLLSETIDIHFELEGEPLWIETDPAHFDQILINLAVNAADAMPEGGELSFRSCVVEQAPPQSADERRAAGAHVCLEVVDTGVGIPEDILPHVFDPFFTTKSIGAGTGLGLANVYGIVRQSGGVVEVESTPGEGTRFFVYLPLLEAPAPRRRSTSAPLSNIPRGNERILLVEDNDAVRNSTRKLLSSLGYQVEAACDGAEALERIWEGLRVDLVLTDLAMPKVGGAELARQLHSRHPELPVVFMSGNLDVAELKAEVEAGRATFLQKPVQLKTLARTTREVLDQTG